MGKHVGMRRTPPGFYHNHTREQLICLVELSELSISSLQRSLDKQKKLAKARLKRLKVAAAELRHASEFNSFPDLGARYGRAARAAEGDHSAKAKG